MNPPLPKCSQTTLLAAVVIANGKYLKGLFQKRLISGLAFCFLVIAGPLCEAQVFQPLQHDTKAIYTTWPDKGPTSSIVVTDTTQQGDTTIFETFKYWYPGEDGNGNYQLEMDPDCEHDGWGSGGSGCLLAVIPSWLGKDPVQQAQHVFHFHSVWDDTLIFNFNLTQGDSTLVYADAAVTVMMIYESADTATYINYTDSVARYRLAHLDASGNSVNSPLHNAPITIGKDLGMIHFMRIDSFPSILQPIEIIGHTGSQSGLYAIYREDIYDFNEGDFGQYKHVQNTYAPGTGYTAYYDITVLTRAETETTISYSFLVETTTIQNGGQWVNGNWVQIIDTVFTTANTASSVNKGVLAELPFEAHDPSMPYVFKNLHFIESECGAGWQFEQRNSLFWHQCSSDGIPCYVNSAHFAPGDGYGIGGNYNFQPGYGQTWSYSGEQIISGPHISLVKTLEYSVKNGEPCGNQWVLSTTTAQRNRNDLRIYPNPATTTVRLDLPGSTLTHATLLDMQGRQVLDVQLSSSEQVIDVSALPKGMYLVKATGINGAQFSSKLMLLPH